MGKGRELTEALADRQRRELVELVKADPLHVVLALADMIQANTTALGRQADALDRHRHLGHGAPAHLGHRGLGAFGVPDRRIALDTLHHYAIRREQ